LGLYICRELCDGHGAVIAYRRAPRESRGIGVEGNEFIVTFRTARAPSRPTHALSAST
jgi:two-component system sensor histidine kinase PilS (NtrC family)